VLLGTVATAASAWKSSRGHRQADATTLIPVIQLLPVTCLPPFEHLERLSITDFWPEVVTAVGQ
jgi:hypothetical protein